MGGGVFRETKTYTALLRKFEPALEEVWMNCWQDDECYRASTDPEDLERLMLAAYRLMKHIRSFLKKKKQDYPECTTIPALHTALEKIANIVVHKNCNLGIEASALEGLSRACYNWMKANSTLNKAKRYPVIWCQSCHTDPATDSVLCDFCRSLERSPNAGAV